MKSDTLLYGALLMSAFSPATATNENRMCFPLPDLNENNVAPRGQITDGTSFGAVLSALARRPDVYRVLEIGTWFGGGSTTNLARGIRESYRWKVATALNASNPSTNCIDKPYMKQRCCQSLVVSLEVFKPAWEHASKLLSKLPVWCILGTTVSANEMLTPKQVPLKDEHFRLYYDRDVRLMKQSKPLLQKLCRHHHFDLVLIDGNEYTGWAEFTHVRTECQPKYLALHDTGTLKTRKIEEYLSLNHHEYRLLLRKDSTTPPNMNCHLIGCKDESQFTHTPAGWSVYERVDSSTALKSE